MAGKIILLLALLALPAFGLDIVTNDGRTYRQCEVRKIEPDALRIVHADGAARIPYEQLPASLQKQYFDPARVAAYRQQLEEAQKAAAMRAADLQRQQAEAAAQAEKLRQEQADERQREEDRKEAEAQTAEKLRLAARHHRRTIMLSLVGLALAVGLFLYFLPTIIARHKANALAIFVFNLFFGWSGIGWVIALVWACTKDSAMDALARQHLEQPRGKVRLRDSVLLHEEALPGEERLRQRGRLQGDERRLE